MEAREALNARVRELIERRLGGAVSPQEEAAEYVRQLRLRGFSSSQIGERLGGVNTATVIGWGQGRRAPSSSAIFERLAMLTRNALQLPVVTEPNLTGMRLVLDTLRRVRRSTMRQLTRDLGLRGTSVGTTWMAGTYKPGRVATLRIRRLVKSCGLPSEMVATCDERLAEIAELARVHGQQGGSGRIVARSAALDSTRLTTT